MANLNDPDAEAFFRQGDEGTYSGGPGDSIPAGVVDIFDDIEDESLPKVTHEHIKRRDRYTRWVTGFVSALGAAAVLGFVVRAVAGDDEAPLSKVVAVSPPTITETPRQPEAPAAPAPVVVREVREETTAVSTPEPAPAAAPIAEEPPPLVTKRAGEAPAPVKATRTSEKRVERSLRSPEVKTVYPAAKSPAVFGHSSPPTANFPD